MNEWISIEEELPKSGELVLAVRELKDGKREVILARLIVDWQRFHAGTGRKYMAPEWVCSGNKNILYWMRIPELPAE